eukprot:1822448-Alexandrium_andersonii.AAC.1
MVALGSRQPAKAMEGAGCALRPRALGQELALGNAGSGSSRDGALSAFSRLAQPVPGVPVGCKWET